MCTLVENEVSLQQSEEVLEKSPSDSWEEVLNNWQIYGQQPQLLNKLIREGVPENLRGQVWRRLSKGDDCPETIDKYNMMLTKVNNLNFLYQLKEILMEAVQ